MASINKVIIVGNLGRDPEARYTASGDCICHLSVATSEKRLDKLTGEKKELTEWHRVVLYRKLGETAAQYLKKGEAVYLEGKLQTRKWTDKEGNDRYTTEIVADHMQMLGGHSQEYEFRDEGVNDDAEDPSSYVETQSHRPQQHTPASRGGQGKRESQKEPREQKRFREFTDDIPF